MRLDGRTPDALRPVTMETGWKRQSDGSVLYRAGGTVVLCVASVDEGVKDFLKGRSGPADAVRFVDADGDALVQGHTKAGWVDVVVLQGVAAQDLGYEILT